MSDSDSDCDSVLLPTTTAITTTNTSVTREIAHFQSEHRLSGQPPFTYDEIERIRTLSPEANTLIDQLIELVKIVRPQLYQEQVIQEEELRQRALARPRTCGLNPNFIRSSPPAATSTIGTSGFTFTELPAATTTTSTGFTFVE